MTDIDHNCHCLLMHAIGTPEKMFNWGIAKSHEKALEMERNSIMKASVRDYERGISLLFMATPLLLLLKGQFTQKGRFCYHSS